MIATHFSAVPVIDPSIIPAGQIDLPAFITAVFNGLANVIAATGGAAANTIAATGGAVANGLGSSARADPVQRRATSAAAGKKIGEIIGRAVAEDMEEVFTGSLLVKK